MSNLNRNELLRILRSANIEVPVSAPVATLRELYSTHIEGAMIDVVENNLNPEPNSTVGMASPDEHNQTSEPNAAQPDHQDRNNIAENIPDNLNDLHADNPDQIRDAPIDHPFIDEGLDALRVGGNPNLNNEIVELDAELDHLRKLTEIARLRAELRALNVDPTHRPNRRRLEYNDIEFALQKFSGDDNYGVKKWIADYEEILASGYVEDRDKLIFARRLMNGTAKSMLLTVSAANWNELKNHLIREFDQTLTRQDVYSDLVARRIRRGETIRQYIIAMQGLAMHADISDNELLQFIFDGLDDSSPTAAILYSAKTIQDLKDAVPVYERRRARVTNTSRTNPIPRAPTNNTFPIRTQTAPPPLQSSTATGNNNNIPSNPFGTNRMAIRCSNCRSLGHHESSCRQPRRPSGSCFFCWEMGHQYRDCPKKRMNVAAINFCPQSDMPSASADEANANDLAALQSVSFSFDIHNSGRNSKMFNSFALLDTGSPVSFIRRSIVPMEMPIQPLHYSQFRGLGDMKIYSYGKHICQIQLKSKTCSCPVFIIPDNILPAPMLLGRDFLQHAGIGLQFINKMNSSKSNSNIGNSIGTIFYPFKSCLSASMFIDRSSSCSPTINTEFNSTQNTPLPLNLFDELPFKDNYNNAFPITLDIAQNFGKIYFDKCHELILIEYIRPPRSKNTPVKHTMKIRLTSDAPLYCNPRRLSYLEKEEVSKVIDDLLIKQIIRPSNSPFASPIVLVKKKGGELRMCIDYRALNKVTVRDNFPLPLIEDCLEYLDRKQCFSILDLKNGFHQVHMDPESIPYTSFVTPFGQFEYIKMPFGLKNGPSVFQRFISTILNDMIRQREIVVYMDDILIATFTPDQHLTILRKLFKRLVEFNLEVKLEKCHFMQTSINYLGYSADIHGISPNDFHVNMLQNYPIPVNKRALQSCLGLFSYFRRFVSNFSRVAGPLYNLLKDNTPFDFNSECQESFYKLRDTLSSAPVLAIYNPNRETELHTDASSHGFGAVLLQKQPDNKWHPVSYYSRRTSQTESKYHSFELESLAIIYALRRFRVYVEGIPFRIVTDCNALTQTLSKSNLNPRIARWALELENYNYLIQHRKGDSMGHVDALSRNPPLSDQLNQHSLLVHEDDIDFRINAAQARDPILLDIRSRLEEGDVEHFELINGLLYRKQNDELSLLYVPAEMETNIIRIIHEKIGHLGADKCYDQIRLHYWFPAMHRKIQSFIKNCLRCIMHTPPVRLHERKLHSIPKAPVPFDTLHIDHFGPLSNIINKNKHILVIIDAFTKFVKLYPCKTTSTKEVCAALDKYFSYYGRPRRLISDRGTAFTSNDFSEYLNENNIIHIKNAVAAPQANGQVERVNRVIGRMLSKLSEPANQSNWSKLLVKVEYAVNNSVHCSTKQTPSVLLFGVHQRGPNVDELTEYLEEKQINDGNQPADLLTIRQDADEAIRNSQIRNEVHYAKRSVLPRKYEVNDFVVMRNVDNSIGKNKKLIPKYRGPYVIHQVLPNDRYIIRDIENCQLTQIPYRGVLEAARLKPWVQVPCGEREDECEQDVE